MAKPLTPGFLPEAHLSYLTEWFEFDESNFEFGMSEHLRMGGIYWCITALDLLGKLDTIDTARIVDFVLGCQNPDGGFGASTQYDSHILHTLSAIQVLVTLDQASHASFNKNACLEFIFGLYIEETGCFYGDLSGKEIDARFLYCALSSLALLNALNTEKTGVVSPGLACPISIKACLGYLVSCQNFDAGYGNLPGSESHAGHIFVCLGSLSILNRLDLVNVDECAWWLAERQLPGEGGLNGRPAKLPDVCYSWWVLSSLKLLNRLEWINCESLMGFILNAQDTDTGGFADRPNHMPDPFHTLFGLCGLSLLSQQFEKPYGLNTVNPTFCMTNKTINRHFEILQ